jgi:hypothetical protein
MGVVITDVMFVEFVLPYYLKMHDKFADNISPDLHPSEILELGEKALKRYYD